MYLHKKYAIHLFTVNEQQIENKQEAGVRS